MPKKTKKSVTASPAPPKITPPEIKKTEIEKPKVWPELTCFTSGQGNCRHFTKDNKCRKLGIDIDPKKPVTDCPHFRRAISDWGK